MEYLQASKESLLCNQDSNANFLSLMNAIPEGLVVINSDGIISSANTKAISYLGYPLVGMRWLAVIDRSFAPRADDGHEVSLRDGKRLKISLKALEGNEGELIVLTDLTETRNLQDQISHLKYLSAMGEMVAALVHQVRTPLSAALLYASNLQNKNIHESDRCIFNQKLLNRLHDLEKQVNNLLLFAREDRLSLKKISLHNVLIDSIKTIEPICSNAKAKVIYKCSDESCKYNIKGNHDLLVSVLTNIFINSVEAGCSNIKIRIKYNADFYYVLIDDDGCGVNSDFYEKIKEPFFTNKSCGTGLGLSVANKIVKNHNGVIKVQRSDLFLTGMNITLVFPEFIQ